MTIKGRDKNYNFKEKNNWRKWAWFTIASKLKDRNIPLEDANILYLGGKEDLDRKVAVSAGLNPNNLFFVDKDERVIKTIRKSGKLAVHGNFIDVTKVAIHMMEVDVIFGDFCCGLNLDLIQLLQALKTSESSIVLINIFRGRDKKGLDYMKKILEKHDLFNMFEEKFVKNRSMYLMYLYFSMMLKEQLENKPYSKKNTRYHITDLQRRTCMITTSYKTGNQNMDTVIFDSVPADKHYKINWKDCDSEIIDLRNQIRTIMAVQTMRKSGKIAPCPSA